MGAFSRWLLHDEQKGLFEIVFACVVNVLFFVPATLLWWLAGTPRLAFGMAKGYLVLWVVVVVLALLVKRIQKFFRVNLYDHPDAFVNSNLAISCFLQAGWAAFVASIIDGAVSAAGAGGWSLVTLYLVGGVSCLVAFYIVSAFYQGSIYKLISLPFALVAYVVFSVWPSSARVIFGWFFDLF